MRILLAIAGLDCSGGAGLATDARVARHHGYHPALVCTALSAQGEGGLEWWEPTPPDGLRAQLRAVLRSGAVAAVKVGMVGRTDAAEVIVKALAERPGLPVVWDPVLGASVGGSLVRGDLAALTPLLRRAQVVTPNLGEVGRLTDRAVADRPAMREAAQRLHRRGARAVLVTGGHLEGDPVDVLYDGARIHEFSGPRLAVEHVRGTGCALSTALACALAQGPDLPEAITAARHYLRARMRETYDLGGRLRYLP